MTGAVTEDGFLGGRLRIRQPARGFRAGMDAVLLAAAVPACEGQSVLDLGCGVGTAALCLAARVAGLELAGVERDAAAAALARANAAMNGLTLEVVEADISALPPALRARRFDHVIANPPFHEAARRDPARDPAREAALSGTLPLAAWIRAGRARLAPHGVLTLILSASRLADALAALAEARGAADLLPLAPRAGRPAHRVLIRWQEGSGAGLTLWPPVALHEGDRHASGARDHVPAIETVLREGAALPWPGAAGGQRQRAAPLARRDIGPDLWSYKPST